LGIYKTMFPNRITNYFIKQPEKLLLLDGIGAVVSALCLGILLVHYEVIFGIPVPTLYFLALWPILFFAYDMVCIFKKKSSKTDCLKGIALLNFSYAVLSAVLTLYHFEIITIFGLLYLVGEIILVLILAFFEYKIALAVISPTS
jgi:hypothetical protein